MAKAEKKKVVSKNPYSGMNAAVLKLRNRNNRRLIKVGDAFDFQVRNKYFTITRTA